MTTNNHLTIINQLADNSNCTITINNNVIQLTDSNRETLWHFVWKHALTTQTETKKFIDKIFKLYEKGDVKISLATLRVIEYMDDELIRAVKHLFIDNNTPNNSFYWKNNKIALDALVQYNLVQHGQPFNDQLFRNPCLDELINLIKLTNQC